MRFTPDGSNGTRVDLEHRNMERFGEGAESMRAGLDGDYGLGSGARELRRGNARLTI